MEKLKRAYYYLFYKLYKFAEAAPSRWWSDWKAGAAIIVLEIWLLIGLISFYNVFVDRYFHLKKSHFTVAGLSIVVLNYLMFVHNDIWKDYIKEFEQLPKKTNKKGSWVVFIIILIIVAFTTLSLYLKSKIDWTSYR